MHLTECPTTLMSLFGDSAKAVMVYETLLAKTPYTPGNKKTSVSSLEISQRTIGMNDKSVMRAIKGEGLSWSVRFVQSNDGEPIAKTVSSFGWSVTEFPDAFDKVLFLDQNARVKDGVRTKNETDSSCLFRHLRNAIAHGNLYSQVGSDWIVLTDKSEGNKGKVTAYCCLTSGDLLALCELLS